MAYPVILYQTLVLMTFAEIQILQTVEMEEILVNNIYSFTTFSFLIQMISIHV